MLARDERGKYVGGPSTVLRCFGFADASSGGSG